MSDDNGTIEKHRATEDEKEERINFTKDLIAQGMERADIVQKLKEKFDIEIRQSYNYYKIAKERFIANPAINLLEELNLSLHTRRMLKRMAFESKQLKLAHEIQEAYDEFIGFDIIAPYLALQANFIQFFQEELIRILIKNNNIIDKEERFNQTISDISQASREIAKQVSLIGSGESTDKDEGKREDIGDRSEQDKPFSIF